MAFVTYYRMFNNQISQVANISSTLQTTLASSERIFEFLEKDENLNVYKTGVLDITYTINKDNIIFNNIKNLLLSCLFQNQKLLLSLNFAESVFISVNNAVCNSFAHSSFYIVDFFNCGVEL